MSQSDINVKQLRAGMGVRKIENAFDPTALAGVLRALELLDARVAALELAQLAKPEPALELELEPEPAPALEPEPEPVPEPAPAPLPSLEEQAAAGTMLVEDEIAYRVGRLSIQIDEYATLLIDSQFNAQAQNEAAQAVQYAINMQALGLALTEDERAAYDYATTMSSWAEAVEAHARQIKLDLPRLDVDLLRVYRVEEAQWPTINGDLAPQ